MFEIRKKTPLFSPSSKNSVRTEMDSDNDVIRSLPLLRDCYLTNYCHISIFSPDLLVKKEIRETNKDGTDEILGQEGKSKCLITNINNAHHDSPHATTTEVALAYQPRPRIPGSFQDGGYNLLTNLHNSHDKVNMNKKY